MATEKTVNVPKNQIAYQYDGIHDCMIMDGVRYPKEITQAMSQLQHGDAVVLKLYKSEDGMTVLWAGQLAGVADLPDYDFTSAAATDLTDATPR